MTVVRVLCVASALVGLVACQTVPYQPYARDAKKRPQQGGVIALKAEHRAEDTAKAQEMMKANCGANEVKVTEEGEVVVGQTTNATATADTNYGGRKQVGTLFGLPLTSGSDQSATTNTNSTTTALKEWQITYECVAANNTEADGMSQAKAVKKKKN